MGGRPPPPGGAPPPPVPPPAGTPPPPPGPWGAPAAGAAGQVLPLRALTVGDVLDGAFRLLRGRFGRVALAVVVVLGPFQFLSSFLASRLLPGGGAFGPPAMGEPDLVEIDDATIAAAFGLMSVTGILGFVVHVVVAGALVWLVLREDAGGRPAVGESLAGGLGRAWALIGGTFLVGLLALAAGAVLAGVIAALVMLAWPLAILVAVPAVPLLFALAAAATSLVVPVAMVETDAGPARCARRALSLVRRRLGMMLGVTVLVLLVLMVVTFAVSMVLGVASWLAGPLAWVVDGVSGTAVSIVTTPVTVFAALLLYVDARVRLEGWDLQLRAQRPRPW